MNDSLSNFEEFQKQNDVQLNRWRSFRNKNFVVYDPDLNEENEITILNEKTGSSLLVDLSEGVDKWRTDFYEVYNEWIAEVYISEYKPWMKAKIGEIWNLEFKFPESSLLGETHRQSEMITPPVNANHNAFVLQYNQQNEGEFTLLYHTKVRFKIGSDKIIKGELLYSPYNLEEEIDNIEESKKVDRMKSRLLCENSERLTMWRSKEYPNIVGYILHNHKVRFVNENNGESEIYSRKQAGKFGPNIFSIVAEEYYSEN